MFIDFVYFVPGLKVGFPGIFLDWNPEMSHFRKFQPERSSGILLLARPRLKPPFPVTNIVGGVAWGVDPPCFKSLCAGKCAAFEPSLGCAAPLPLVGRPRSQCPVSMHAFCDAAWSCRACRSQPRAFSFVEHVQKHKDTNYSRTRPGNSYE